MVIPFADSGGRLKFPHLWPGQNPLSERQERANISVGEYDEALGSPLAPRAPLGKQVQHVLVQAHALGFRGLRHFRVQPCKDLGGHGAVRTGRQGRQALAPLPSGPSPASV